MKLPISRPGRIWLVVVFALAGIIVAFVLPPLRQPEAYHHFADERCLMGVPNCLNVISNAGFLVVGIMGLYLTARNRGTRDGSGFILPAERAPYAVFFAGVLLTCFGSGYYHWNPINATLAWDRLPMTVAFMSLLSATVVERIDVRAGLRSLWPLVLAGVLSVGWWRWTDNLWPYAAAQYFSILLICLILALFPARYSRSVDLFWVAALYGLAKVFEALDRRIFDLTGIISGHTLKHLVAAVAVYWIWLMLRRRSPQYSPKSAEFGGSLTPSP